MYRSMHRLLGCAFAVAFACPSVALAAIENRVSASARGPGGEVQTNSDPSTFLFADRLNSVGGHGYSELALDYGSGVVAARTHACIGPRLPVSRDTASGSSSTNSEETIVARVDSLGYGALFTVTLCYSVTSNVYGYVTHPALTLGASAENFFSMSVTNPVGNQRVFDARHSYSFKDDSFSLSSGLFAGVANEIVTHDGMFSFSVQNGIPFTISAQVRSETSASANGGTNISAIVDGSAGCAMTFGLTSANGARFTWRGAEWTGNCGSSASLVPDNPIPAPSAAAALVLVGGVSARRRIRCG